MNVLAAFTFFTRLPFWRIKEVPQKCFGHIVPYWPLVGWLTGGIMAGVLWLSAQILPFSIAVILAIISRLILTGALHEDGLADFIDGFGGGTTRERILEIMKDSHIGSYGVIGLIAYFLLLWNLLSTLTLPMACVVIISGDVWSKYVSSQIINVLPYARNMETSKAKTVYNRMSISEFCFGMISGVLPLLLLLPSYYWIAGLFPLLSFILLCLFMKRKLNAYTGDCCGAVFLISELSFYFGIIILYHL